MRRADRRLPDAKLWQSADPLHPTFTCEPPTSTASTDRASMGRRLQSAPRLRNASTWTFTGRTRSRHHLFNVEHVYAGSDGERARPADCALAGASRGLARPRRKLARVQPAGGAGAARRAGPAPGAPQDPAPLLVRP